MEHLIPEKLGRYEIVRVLGRGAMGVVYEGRDPNLGRRVAIKTARREMLAESEGAGEVMARFLREARVAGMLNHPNIITIYDAGEEEGTAFIAMEFVEGEDLSSRMAAKRRPNVMESVELVAMLAEALAHAHEHGIVHRDIKPANIMLPWRGPAKIADFGIARVADSNLTQDGTLIGTPSYMSPEQFMGHRVDGRSDLFSLSIILYELLTGEKPFAGEAFSTIMHHVLRTAPTPAYELNYSVPNALGQVVAKAMNKRPQDRYSDGKAFAAALLESLKDHPDPVVLEGRSVSEATTLRTGEISAVAMMETDHSQTHHGDAPTMAGSAPDGPMAAVLSTVSGNVGTENAGFAETIPPDPAAGSKNEALKRSRTPIVAGLLAMLLLTAGVGLSIYNKGNTRAITDQASRTGDTQYSGADDSAKISILVSVYVTKDPLAASGFGMIRNTPDKAAAYVKEQLQKGTIKPFAGAGATLVVSDPSSHQQYATEPLTEDGIAMPYIPENAKRVLFLVKDGKGGVQYDLSLDPPYWRQAQSFLIFDDGA